MKCTPLVSVVMPAYKTYYIREALKSLLEQSYLNIELVVCDDSDNEEIGNIVEEFASQVNFPIRYFKNETRLGEGRSSSKGAELAQGKYIKFIHDDDILLPPCIEILVNVMESNPRAALATSKRQRIDKNNQLLDEVFYTENPFGSDVLVNGFDLASFLADHTINFIGEPSCILCRKSDVVNFDEPLGWLNGKSIDWVGDLAIYVKLLQVGDLIYLSESLTQIRISVEQYSQKGRDQPGIGNKGHQDFRQAIRDLGWFRKTGDNNLVQIARLNQNCIAGSFRSFNLLNALNSAAGLQRQLATSKEASIEQWLQKRVMTEQQLALDKNIHISCSCVIANFDNNFEALAQTQKNIELQQGALSALTLNPIQVVQLDTFAAQVNEWLHKSDDDWLLVMSAGEELTSSGLIMAQIELSQNPTLSAISFDEIYRQHDGELGAALRPSVNLDYLLSFPAGMSRHWLFNRQALLDIGGFNVELPEAFELDALLRLISVKGLGCLGHIPEPLVITPMPALANVDDERKAIEGFLQVQGYASGELHAPNPGRYQIRYNHPSQPIVSIVLAAGKNLQNLQRCVEGLLGSTSYQSFEILFIEQPDSGVAVKEWLAGLAAMLEPKLKVVVTAHTALAAQYHDAETQAIGDYLLFLSPDTAVISEHWLDEILNHAQRSEVGIVGVKLLTVDGKIAHAGHLLGLEGPIGSPFVGDDSNAPGYMQRLQVTQNLSAVGGDCMMVLRELFVQLGGFTDSSLADQYLTSDLCLRARGAGFLIVWTPHAQLMLEKHDVIAATAEQQDAMYEKWLPQLARDPAYNPNFSLSMPGGFKLADSQISWRPLDSIRPAPVALVHPADLFGCGHYRVMQPFLAMKEAGLVDGAISTGLMHVTDLERYNPDTIILQRQIGDERLEAMQRMQRFSKAFKVYELDDYLPNLPLKSVHRANMPKDILRSLRKGLSFVDRFVVSTEPLAEAFSGLHDEIVVMENRLPVSWWQGLQTQRRQGKKPRVGWAGGSSHTGDLELIADVVRDLADEVEWVFFGMCPDKLLPYVHEYHDGVAIEQYPAKLASLNLDLGLAPLEMNLFNECKSNLRLLEYGACGIPVVCTDIRCYQNDFPVMRVRNRYKDWVEAIRMHINDLDRAAKLGDELQAKVRQEWMLEGVSLELWRKVWLPS